MFNFSNDLTVKKRQFKVTDVFKMII